MSVTNQWTIDDRPEPPASSPTLELRPLESPEDAVAFRMLNEEWIAKFFVLEKKDSEVLEHPESAIVGKGGRILMACVEGEPVGCTALIPMGEGVFELSKMAVSPRLRGLGIGRKLILYAIAEARLLGARSLFLGSSKKLKNAVHLYESVGFRHVPAENIPPMEYARADVFMEMEL